MHNFGAFVGIKNGKKIKSTKPQSRLGILNVVDDLEPGFAYKVDEGGFPMSVNVQTGWICVGDPEKRGNAVEFMNNSIAVIDNSGHFISLWLKIENLPDLDKE